MHYARIPLNHDYFFLNLTTRATCAKQLYKMSFILLLGHTLLTETAAICERYVRQAEQRHTSFYCGPSKVTH